MKLFQQTNHSDNLKRIFAEYFVSKLFSDVTICCGGKTFQAHKLRLCMASRYFKNIFQHDSADHSIVYLQDVTPKELALVLEYCYKGEVSLSKNNLQGFLEAAATLQIESLFSEEATDVSIISDTSEEVIINEISTNNNSADATFIENPNGQSKNINPSSSHFLVNPTQPSNILESPPSSIRNSQNEPADESPPSTPESFVFNLRTSLPLDPKSQQSVVILSPSQEVLEISSEEIAGEIKEINQASEDITQIEEDLTNHDINSSDSDESEIVIKKRRIETITKEPTNKQLQVVLERVNLNQNNKDSSVVESTKFSEKYYTTKVIDLRDVPENKKQSYCHLCRRCVRPLYITRHRMRHRMLD
ncbi:unnamed protein product [Ceutorhynchus assimilis]|uniref:BTB domain-containing protein n=1 Tax=Ceutorhynchus assimilis TaxID=467358 RepID=A0A9N9MNG4_9CUCU|nr:unnamed protein product [Ceutorhynchus assimilis]